MFMKMLCNVGASHTKYELHDLVHVWSADAHLDDILWTFMQAELN